MQIYSSVYMLDSKQVGNLTELRCITSFYELGYKISLPYGENSRYDFIADINNKLYRIQVKTCKESEDKSSFEIPCRSTRTNSKGAHQRRYTKDEIDYFATYYNGNCYLIPIGECSVSKRIRLKESKNSQEVNVNYAKDYLLSSQLKRILDE